MSKNIIELVNEFIHESREGFFADMRPSAGSTVSPPLIPLSKQYFFTKPFFSRRTVAANCVSIFYKPLADITAGIFALVYGIRILITGQMEEFGKQIPADEKYTYVGAMFITCILNFTLIPLMDMLVSITTLLTRSVATLFYNKYTLSEAEYLEQNDELREFELYYSYNEERTEEVKAQIREIPRNLTPQDYAKAGIEVLGKQSLTWTEFNIVRDYCNDSLGMKIQSRPEDLFNELFPNTPRFCNDRIL